MIKGVLLDLSGVLYVDDVPINGAIAAIERLQQSSLPHCFITNTTRRRAVAIQQILQQMGFAISEDNIFTASSAALDYIHAQEITGYLVELYKNQSTDLIEIVYNEFKNAAQQNIIVEKYLPLTSEKFEGEVKHVNYIYEPDELTLLEALLPKHLNIQTWRILLESNAAEQGARMTAMEAATENAGELISDLTLSYNKARQSAITKEISEIVGGAEALKSA